MKIECEVKGQQIKFEHNRWSSVWTVSHEGKVICRTSWWMDLIFLHTGSFPLDGQIIFFKLRYTWRIVGIYLAFHDESGKVIAEYAVDTKGNPIPPSSIPQKDRDSGVREIITSFLLWIGGLLVITIPLIAVLKYFDIEKLWAMSVFLIVSIIYAVLTISYMRRANSKINTGV